MKLVWRIVLAVGGLVAFAAYAEAAARLTGMVE